MLTRVRFTVQVVEEAFPPLRIVTDVPGGSIGDDGRVAFEPGGIRATR
jgi:hypothetical protein